MAFNLNNKQHYCVYKRSLQRCSPVLFCINLKKWATASCQKLLFFCLSSYTSCYLSLIAVAKRGISTEMSLGGFFFLLTRITLVVCFWWSIIKDVEFAVINKAETIVLIGDHNESLCLPVQKTGGDGHVIILSGQQTVLYPCFHSFVNDGILSLPPPALNNHNLSASGTTAFESSTGN